MVERILKWLFLIFVKCSGNKPEVTRVDHFGCERLLPLNTQLQTCRRAAPSDAMCQTGKSVITPIAHKHVARMTACRPAIECKASRGRTLIRY
jgi:hypothetical protein